MKRKRKVFFHVISILLMILGIMLLGGLLVISHMQDQENHNMIIREQQSAYEELTAAIAARTEQEAKDSFYQKLQHGYDVDILVLGEGTALNPSSAVSILAGTNNVKHWTERLGTYLQDIYMNDPERDYNGRVNVENLAIDDSTTYEGYLKMMSLDDQKKYDMVILCYGITDSSDGFSTRYEALIRNAYKKFEGCSVMSLIEASEQISDRQIEIFRELGSHYNIPVVDVLDMSSRMGAKNSMLTFDGIHLNELGQEVYFSAVRDEIDSQVEKKTKKAKLENALNEDVKLYNEFTWYGIKPVKADDVEQPYFKRVNDTTFVLSTKTSGMLGMIYSYICGNNSARVYIDNTDYGTYEYSHAYNVALSAVQKISDSCEVKEEIKVVFENKKQADTFQGMGINK